MSYIKETLRKKSIKLKFIPILEVCTLILLEVEYTSQSVKGYEISIHVFISNRRARGGCFGRIRRIVSVFNRRFNSSNCNRAGGCVIKNSFILKKNGRYTYE